MNSVSMHVSEQKVTTLALKYARRELPLVEEKVFLELMQEAKDKGVSASDLDRAYVTVRYSLEVWR